MPRNIIFPDEQQNQPSHLTVPSKNTQKRNSNSSNFSDDQTMIIDTKWRTNLLIPTQGERVQKRKQGYRKNTSFQNKIINDHIQVMVQTVCEIEENHHLTSQCQHICYIASNQQAKSKQGIIQQKLHSLINQNTYLTEQEKHQFLLLFSNNFDNYQILIKTTHRLQMMNLLSQQLIFMLVKVVQFISTHYEVNSKKYDRQFLQLQVVQKLNDVIKTITWHQNIKLINPEFIKIIQAWFYTAFAIKLGVSYNKFSKKSLNQVQEMDIQM